MALIVWKLSGVVVDFGRLVPLVALLPLLALTNATGVMALLVPRPGDRWLQAGVLFGLVVSCWVFLSDGLRAIEHGDSLLTDRGALATFVVLVVCIWLVRRAQAAPPSLRLA